MPLISCRLLHALVYYTWIDLSYPRDPLVEPTVTESGKPHINWIRDARTILSQEQRLPQEFCQWPMLRNEQTGA